MCEKCDISTSWFKKIICSVFFYVFSSLVLMQNALRLMTLGLITDNLLVVEAVLVVSLVFLNFLEALSLPNSW